MKSKAYSPSSSSFIICCFFMIWIFIVSPVLSARILATTPSHNGGSKMPVNGSNSLRAGSAVGQTPPTTVTRSGAGAIAKPNEAVADCSSIYNCRSGGKTGAITAKPNNKADCSSINRCRPGGKV